MTLPESKLTQSQAKVETKYFNRGKERFRIKARIRHDDNCGNGHNTFAITGDIDRIANNGRIVEESGGCIHDDIAKHFPDLAPLIKWHLVSTDGPMHYVGNTVYLAGDTDYNGLREGETQVSSYKPAIVFGDNPIQHAPHDNGNGRFVDWLQEYGTPSNYDFEVIAMHHKPEPDGRRPFGPKFTYGGFDGCTEWHQAPFDSEDEALRFLRALQTCSPRYIQVPRYIITGEGNPSDIEAARSTAVWPDATLEQLQDEDALQARLPALMVEFKAAVESLGFEY